MSIYSGYSLQTKVREWEEEKNPDGLFLSPAIHYHQFKALVFAVTKEVIQNLPCSLSRVIRINEILYLKVLRTIKYCISKSLRRCSERYQMVGLIWKVSWQCFDNYKNVHPFDPVKFSLLVIYSKETSK